VVKTHGITSIIHARPRAVLISVPSQFPPNMRGRGVGVYLPLKWTQKCWFFVCRTR